MSTRKRYVQVGIGARSYLYIEAMVGSFRDLCEVSGMCDTNQARMDLCNRRVVQLGGSPIRTYPAAEFEKMIADTKPDVVIVTTGPDSTHCYYICRAMELGCDVITEKPMTIDEISCQNILKTMEQTGRNLQVAFNYRYSPPRSQVKEMIMNGAVGRILSVDFAWLLDTRHGADYFRRWHRRRQNSGSLLVHKATHHFDLVNWWISDVPDEVYGQASREFYTPEMADNLGLKGRASRCLECPLKGKCDFYMDFEALAGVKELYLDCEHEDSYMRDRCVFADDIDIWDNMSLLVRYNKGALLNYILHAYSPYEGYQIAINGTEGRLEHRCCEKAYVSGDGTVPGEIQRGSVSIVHIPKFSKAKQIEVRTGGGGHGGGDPVLLTDIFNPNAPADPLGRKAWARDGAYSILIGVAACKSIDSKKAIRISDLLPDSYE